MAGTVLNTYSNIDTNILNVQNVLTQAFKKYNTLTLTHMADTTVPAIAASSAIEIGGSIVKFSSEEAISTTDPHTATTVADGVVYVMINGATCLAYFTATAPTWSDSKQGWYGISAYAGYKYIPIAMIKASTSYSYKYYFNDYNYNIINNPIAITGTTPASPYTSIALLPGFTYLNTIILDTWILESGVYRRPIYISGTDFLYVTILQSSSVIRLTYSTSLRGLPYQLLIAHL